MGNSGNGKSTALQTLCDQGITVFAMATEQNFFQANKAYIAAGKMHYKFFETTNAKDFSDIEDMLRKISMLSYENLTKTTDPFKQQHNKFIDFATSCNKFVCDCCKKDWGAVKTWNTDRALAIDSMSGASEMAFALVIGNKPVKAPPDYQVAQQALLMLLKKICTELRCTFVLIAHISREKDELTGGTFITINTVGKALGPELPRMFSDVILAERNANIFTWDTANSNATVAARHIPIAVGQKPSFAPLIEKWKKDGGKIEETK